MSNDDVIDLGLIVTIPDGTEEELDTETRHLLMRLREFDIESADLVSDVLPPLGTKAVDPVTAGAIALAVLPVTLPRILEFLQIWSLQGRGRTIKFKGRVANQNIDFEGSFAEMEKLVAMLEKQQKKKKK